MFACLHGDTIAIFFKPHVRYDTDYQLHFREDKELHEHFVFCMQWKNFNYIISLHIYSAVVLYVVQRTRQIFRVNSWNLQVKNVRNVGVHTETTEFIYKQYYVAERLLGRTLYPQYQLQGFTNTAKLKVLYTLPTWRLYKHCLLAVIEKAILMSCVKTLGCSCLFDLLNNDLIFSQTIRLDERCAHFECFEWVPCCLRNI